MHRLSVALLVGLLPAGAALKPPQDVQTYAQTVARQCTRIAYFGTSGSPGQLNIQYGQPAWKGEYDHQLEQLRGQRIRFGKDFWTTLDTNVDLTIGGTAVPAGYYYLALGRTPGGDWALVLYDPVELRRERADAFVTPRYAVGGIEAPLVHGTLQGERADRLVIELQPLRELGLAKLVIRWGRHELTAPVVAKLDQTARHSPATAPDGLRNGEQQG
jgi:hypothetical protein